MKDKIYIVVRGDLSPGAKACQGLHAFREYIRNFPEEELSWYNNSNHVCFLSTKGQNELNRLYGALLYEGFNVVAFLEPDMDHELTAICVEPSARNYLAGLPLV